MKSLNVLNSMRLHGIEIFQPSFRTILSLFSANPKFLFEHLMNDFKTGKGSGLYGWLTPVGKPFLVVTDSQVLSQIIVENQPKLVKQHAFGILEYFRKTDLVTIPAWKVVHKIASKFPVRVIHNLYLFMIAVYLLF